MSLLQMQFGDDLSEVITNLRRRVNDAWTEADRLAPELAIARSKRSAFASLRDITRKRQEAEARAAEERRVAEERARYLQHGRDRLFIFGKVREKLLEHRDYLQRAGDEMLALQQRY